jgi:hypothetical protein
VRLHVVTRPADDDALVIDMVRPASRVAAELANGVGDLVAACIDMVAGPVSDRQSNVDNDLGERPAQRATSTCAAGEPHLIGPNPDFHLTIGLCVGTEAFRDDRIGDLVAELVGVTR